MSKMSGMLLFNMGNLTPINLFDTKFSWSTSGLKRHHRFFHPRIIIIIITLITNRWAWGRCPWKQVVVPSEMQALSRVYWYPWQPGELHHHTDKLSEDIYQRLYSPRQAKREGRRRGQTATKAQDLELEIAWLSRVSMHHLKLSQNLHVK